MRYSSNSLFMKEKVLKLKAVKYFEDKRIFDVYLKIRNM